MLKYVLIGILAASSGCSLGAYSDSPVDGTVGDLEFLGKVLTQLKWDDCQNAECLLDLLQVAEKKGYCERYLVDRGTKDRWEHPYTLVREKRENRLVLRIISNGPNERFENGAGDDLTAEFQIFKDGRTIYEVHSNNR